MYIHPTRAGDIEFLILDQMQDQYNYEMEERIMDWIEDVTGFAMDSFYANLKTGTALDPLHDK